MDTSGIIRYLSFKKVINICKIYFGYSLSIIFKRAYITGLPHSLTIEPTNRCNLQCIECPTGNRTSERPRGNLQFDLYKKLIDDLKSYLVYQMIYFQGEPFLNPEIFRIIKYANESKIYTCTSTNGHFLTRENCTKIIESGLKKIIISIDGATRETYQKYRVSGDLEKVKTGIHNLISTKQELDSMYPHVIIQFLVFRHNEHQINEIKQVAKSLGVDKLELKSAQIEDFELNKKLIPSVKRYSRYYFLKDDIKIKNKLKNRCFRIWSTMVVSWEGLMVPCCFDKNLTYTIGSLIDENYRKLWFSEDFNSFRENILRNRGNNRICRNCTEGLRIKN